MKTVKRIFAIAVAVLLIAMMIPAAFAGTDSDPNVISWTCTKEGETLKGYEYTVYTVATYSSDTGAFTLAENASGVTQADINGAVSETEMNALAEKCKDATLPAEGTTFNTNNVSGSFHLADGIYYIKCTTPGPNNKAITQESIVVFPNADNATTRSINFGGKVNEGQPEANKYFLVNGSTTKNAQSFGTTDYKFGKTETDTTGKDKKTITYVLEADIPGSATNLLESYVITDRMGTGLKAVTADNIVSVVVKPKTGAARTLTKGTEWTFTTSSSDIERAKADTLTKENETTDNTFGIKLDKTNVLQDTTKTFYGDGNKVVVTFTTELDYDVVKNMIGQEITNEDDMIYSNTSGYEVVSGGKVVAKTYNAFAKKLDATTNQPIAGKSAKFGLFEDAACSNSKKIAEATSDTTTGIADFGVTLPADTYYIKELEAPTGYNLNSEIMSATLGDGQNEVATFTAEISDTPAKLPSTGGAGTLVFTIVGGSLVLLAAALFIIVMKKRSSAK